MHAHAMALAPESYEHLPPDTVGNTRRALVWGEMERGVGRCGEVWGDIA